MDLKYFQIQIFLLVIAFSGFVSSVVNIYDGKAYVNDRFEVVRKDTSNLNVLNSHVIGTKELRALTADEIKELKTKRKQLVEEIKQEYKDRKTKLKQRLNERKNSLKKKAEERKTRLKQRADELKSRLEKKANQKTDVTVQIS